MSAAARRDRERLAAFLVEVSPEAAERAVESIGDALERLSMFPEQGTPIAGDMRELMIGFGQSGYVARYRVDAHAVVIARVFHMREDRRGSGD